MSDLIVYLQQTLMPKDGGMLYTETDLTQLFPEPLNALSSLVFLVLSLWWLWRLRGNYRPYSYLSFAVFLLLIGAIGGSVYHGLRLWRPFIMMDWLPIMLLCIFTGIHFLIRASRWYIAIPVVLAYAGFITRSAMRTPENIQFWINLNYFLMSLLVVLPVLWYLAKTKFRHGRFFLVALFSFGFALLFRIADPYGWLSTGTHFLWHLFGALATACMLELVYRVRREEVISS